MTVETVSTATQTATATSVEAVGQPIRVTGIPNEVAERLTRRRLGVDELKTGGFGLVTVTDTLELDQLVSDSGDPIRDYGRGMVKRLRQTAARAGITLSSPAIPPAEDVEADDPAGVRQFTRTRPCGLIDC